ncbi:3-keto-disaccharide hydrolase [Paludibaculum fermentans]|uniref:DUF1080 domain-containing protein n=1 Tax=Paludibaculum fermentans TaxID=1473598 RepID=A0A7S7SMC0_PALFE|nr:DUF1080 domain-containing protein [Paludibaculum fermentans]QOY91102.1 DUF1080 domain-containing protein [Paludibaculum fermentans]
MFRRSLLLFAGVLVATLGLWAQDAPYLTQEGWKPLLNGTNLEGWHAMDPTKPHEWVAARGIRFDRMYSPKALSFVGSAGDRMVNGKNGRTQNFVTDQKFGDIELYIEWMIPKGANSGVYLHGLYEIQILDSFGSQDLTTGDCAAVYHRWINNRPVGGSAPKVNAMLAPGNWQRYHIWFRAPRFDASGKKTENARFLLVMFNGVEVQRDVEVPEGTRAHMEIPEAATNPLMLQGDHGPVAFRNIYWRPLGEIPER